jgi:hypothetical protein
MLAFSTAPAYATEWYVISMATTQCSAMSSGVKQLRSPSAVREFLESMNIYPIIQVYRDASGAITMVDIKYTPTLRKSGKYPLPTALKAILLHP